jgi:hypothetical protein
MTPLQDELIEIIGREPDYIEHDGDRKPDVVLVMSWRAADDGGLDVLLDEEGEHIEGIIVNPSPKTTAAMLAGLVLLFIDNTKETA